MVQLPFHDIDVPGANASGGTSKMRVHVAGSERKNAPIVLVFPEVFGINAHMKNTAQKIADRGYIAIAPEVFHRTAPAGWTHPYEFNDEVKKHYAAVNPETLTQDLKAIEAWVKTRNGWRTDRMASVGFCLGGQVSFLANAVLPLRAAACFYGGGIYEVLLPLGIAEKQHGPVQLVWGGQDTNISYEKTRKIEDELKKAGKVFSNLVFSEAPHAFTNADRPSYHPQAAAEAWGLTFAFLENKLAI